jgi:hypothetical protein
MLVGIIDAKGHKCQKDVSIVVNSGVSCDVFSNLVWTENYQVGTSTGLFTGPSWSATSSGTCTADDSGAFGGGSYTGLGTYNGPASNCNLHVTAIGTAGVDPGASYFNVDIYFGGLLVGHAYISIDVTIFLGPGTYDIPFNMPDTGGVDVAVEVDVIWGSGLHEVAGTGSVSMVGSAEVTSVCS